MRAGSFKDDIVAQIPGLRAFAVSLSGSQTLADDLLQETLLRAWSNSEKFRTGTNLRAWLLTILRNSYYSQYRKRALARCRTRKAFWRRASPSPAIRRATSISLIFAKRFSGCRESSERH
jgi:DNA-directed RNA polymerase specialized sigma24 family protein